MAAKKKGTKSAPKAKTKAAPKLKKKAAPKRKAVKRAAPKKVSPRPAVAAAPNPWKSYGAWFAQEVATTLKVLRAYPAEQQGFQTHPRSGTAMQLCWTFAIEQGIVVEAITGTLKMPPNFPPAPPTFADGIAAFERKANEVKAAIAAAKPADWGRLLQFFTGPGQMGMVPASVICHLMLCDQIHHRGQLSVSVRMAGGKVPSIYGPSADEPW